LENVRLGVVGVKSHPQSLHPHCDDGLARLVNHNRQLRFANGDSDSPIPSLIVSPGPADRKLLQQPRLGHVRMSSTDPPQAIPRVPSQFHFATLSTWLTTVRGHSSVAFTLDRYGHLYEDREDEIPERLDQLLTTSSAGLTRAQSKEPQSRDDETENLTSTFEEWPQRDLNPCYRLERAAS
jgi:hypothetical protein